MQPAQFEQGLYRSPIECYILYIMIASSLDTDQTIWVYASLVGYQVNVYVEPRAEVGVGYTEFCLLHRLGLFL